MKNTQIRLFEPIYTSISQNRLEEGEVDQNNMVCCGCG